MFAMFQGFKSNFHVIQSLCIRIYIVVRMSRQSIQKIKAMLLCIKYGILFVNTVDMKIKACNALNAMFVGTVNTGVCAFYTTLYTE